MFDCVLEDDRITIILSERNFSERLDVFHTDRQDLVVVDTERIPRLSTIADRQKWPAGVTENSRFLVRFYFAHHKNTRFRNLSFTLPPNTEFLFTRTTLLIIRVLRMMLNFFFSGRLFS